MDRRVARTRRLLREALVELILVRGWEAISVHDVCERADVGRSTFYAHFGDKEALLVSGFEDLRLALRAANPAADPPLGFVRSLAEHADENRSLFRALVGRKSGAVVQARFRTLVRDLVSEDLVGRDALTVEFVAGGLLGMLGAWVDHRQGSPADLQRDCRRLTDPILAATSVIR